MAVNIGARIGALADAGEVLVSSTVRELVVGSGLEFDDRGAHDAEGRPRRMAPVRGLLALATSDRVDARTASAPIEPATPAQPVGAAPPLRTSLPRAPSEDVGTALTEHPVPAGSRKDAVGGASGADTVAPAAGADEVTARARFDEVASPEGHDHIRAGRAGQMIVAGRSGDRRHKTPAGRGAEDRGRRGRLIVGLAGSF